jgi:hypothetical protein
MDWSLDIIIYSPTLPHRTSVRIIEGSLPLLLTICEALAHINFIRFGGGSFEDICPMNANSLGSVRRLLNLYLSNFSVSRHTIFENLSLICDLWYDPDAWRQVKVLGESGGEQVGIFLMRRGGQLRNECHIFLSFHFRTPI